jgi:ribosome-associated toxin RatA of RatAB toxin-antitoxin module
MGTMAGEIWAGSSVKDLRGQATGTVSVDAQQCFAVLLAVDRYPRAYPEVVRRVEVIDRHANGSPLMALATVSLAVGPMQRDFELRVRMSWKKDRLVRLTRVPNDRADLERVTLTWHISPGPPTRLTVKLRARLEVPRVIPVRGAGGAVARGLLEAASRTLEGP